MNRDESWEHPAQLAAIPFQGIAEGAMAVRQFWVDREAEFEKLGDKYPGTDVYGDLGSSLWWFSGLPPGARDDLEIAATNAARELPDRDAGRPLWCQWLDFVRDFTLNRDWGFKLVDYTMPQTRKKGPAELRLEKFRASLCDAAENKPEWTPINLVAQLGEFERARLQEQAEAFQKEPGIIESVFESSARVCRELAGHAVESEAAASAAAAGIANLSIVLQRLEQDYILEFREKPDPSVVAKILAGTKAHNKPKDRSTQAKDAQQYVVGGRLALCLLGPNPFPETDSRHASWVELFFQASRECDVLFQDCRNKPEDDLAAVQKSSLKLYASTFRACAKSLQELCTPDDLDCYRRQLAKLRKNTLAQAKRVLLPTAEIDVPGAQSPVETIPDSGLNDRKRNGDNQLVSVPITEREAPQTGRRKPRRRTLDHREKLIRKAIRQGHQGKNYVEYLDGEGLTTPQVWQKNADDPCPRLHKDAFENRYWREMMQKEKSRIRARMLRQKTR